MVLHLDRPLAALTKLGIAAGWLASAWLARPSDKTSLEGWAFASLWCAGAWLLAFLLQPPRRSALGTAANVGILLGLSLGEAVFVAAVDEPLLVLVKPLLLAAPAVLGGVLGHALLDRALRPDSSLEFTRFGRRCEPGTRRSYHRRVPG